MIVTEWSLHSSIFFYGDSYDLYAIFKKIITIDVQLHSIVITIAVRKLGGLKKGNKWEYKVIIFGGTLPQELVRFLMG